MRLDPLLRPVHVSQNVAALCLVQIIIVAGAELTSVSCLRPGRPRGIALGCRSRGVLLGTRRHPGAMPTFDLGQGMPERQMRNQSRAGLRRVRRTCGILFDDRLRLFAQQLQIERCDLAVLPGEVFGDQLHGDPRIFALVTRGRCVLELGDVGLRLVEGIRRLVRSAEGLLGSVKHARRLLSESFGTLLGCLWFPILGLQLVSVAPGASRASGGLNAMGPTMRPLGGSRPHVKAGCESLVHAMDLRLPICINVGNAQHLVLLQQGGFKCPVVDEDPVGGRCERFVVLPDVEGLEGGVALFEDVVQLGLGNVAVAVFVDGADEAEHQREALGGALHDSLELRLFHLLLVPGAGSLEDAGPSRSILSYIFFVVLQGDARHLFVLENQLHRDILKR